ncbi:MAG: adenosine deaminase [Planctomycetes bacterium]|nr:adenosine deaminase [Planctomycetota bacterium]
MAVQTRQDLQALPKIDLHRHLEGSVRPATFLEIARTRHIPLPTDDLEGLCRLIQVTDDPPDFLQFLSKFDLFRGFWPDREAIERVAFEAVEDAAQDHVVYLELRYAPVHFARKSCFRAKDVIEWVTAGARCAAAQYGLRVEFIATVARHYPLEVNLPGIEAVLEMGRDRFVGFDVAGDEIHFPLDPFEPYLRRVKEIGLGLTLHAGEAGGAGNVRQAIERFQAERIGHGVHVIQDESTVQLALQRGVTFEMCLTSNLQTATVPSLALHPAKDLLDRGLCITLNTDDPSISRTNLTREWELALSEARFLPSDLLTVSRNAVQAAFLPEREKSKIRQILLRIPNYGQKESGLPGPVS